MRNQDYKNWYRKYPGMDISLMSIFQASINCGTDIQIHQEDFILNCQYNSPRLLIRKHFIPGTFFLRSATICTNLLSVSQYAVTRWLSSDFIPRLLSAQYKIYCIFIAAWSQTSVWLQNPYRISRRYSHFRAAYVYSV